MQIWKYENMEICLVALPSLRHTLLIVAEALLWVGLAVAVFVGVALVVLNKWVSIRSTFSKDTFTSDVRHHVAFLPLHHTIPWAHTFSPILLKWFPKSSLLTFSRHTDTSNVRQMEAFPRRANPRTHTLPPPSMFAMFSSASMFFTIPVLTTSLGNFFPCVTYKLRALNHGIQQIAVSLLFTNRVAEVGSFSARAIFLTKKFVRRVFAIFATNASFLCVIANLQI